MAITEFDFESGANGDTATTGNTGASGTGVTVGTIQISTAWAARGTRSLAVVRSTTSGTNYIFYTISSATTLGIDVVLYVDALPSAEQGILYVGAGATREMSYAITTTGQLRIRDGANANIWTSTATMSVGNAYRISTFQTQNASTGTARAAFYSGAGGTTALDDSTLLTARNTGSAAYTQLRIGGSTGTSTASFSGKFDLFRYDPAATGLLAAPTATPPVLPASPTQTYYTFVDLSATSFAVGPGAFSASPSTDVVSTSTGLFLPTPDDGSTATYTITATDTGNSATDTDSVDVALPISTQDVIETVVWNGSAWV